MLTGRKLALSLAFTVLVAVAFGVGCQGFFTNPTMASFTLSSTSPTVPYGGTTQLHAYGIDSDNNQMGDVTSRITWASSNNGIISIGTAGTTPATTPGLMTGVTGNGLSTSTVTITASYEALSPQTATASVCVEGGTNFTINPAGESGVGQGIEVQYTATTDALVGTVETKDIDITAAVQWTSSNTDVATVVNGTDPMIATTGTTGGTTTIGGSYTCNGTTNTFSTTLGVSQ
jgi:hypothetical protein